MCLTPTGFDHKQLYAVTKVVTRNLNKVIDVNLYPVPEARTSNMRHRPIGIGIQVPLARAAAPSFSLADA